MTNYMILLPNSEGKVSGGDEEITYRLVSNLKKYNHFIKLQPQRDYILDEIKKTIRMSSEDELSSFFDLKGDNLKSAISTMSALKDEECMSAIERMAGVMYNSINYAQLNKESKERFNNSVLILDALFGMLKPLDMIPNYKCKVSMRLFDMTLAKYWQKELSGYFEYECRDKLVLDLLPNSHKEMIKDMENSGDIIEIVFAKQNNNSYTLEGHASKILKGEFVQYVLEFDRLSREDLKKFEHTSGHRYSKEFSNQNKFVYIK
ncbi:MAG: peroxide stress protein YaaA [Candidatus Nanoarchaeia archaeon]